ncbi:oxidoreductase [Undibacterium macrobrachii]|uniref:Oxidoreductase n=2 Tax=Undibacterium macrobrachii TaxID=1119058 RepID=A0ABQ2XHM7_9BURK|nr:oxidoreductase [Undibacterium macrobrachii]
MNDMSSSNTLAMTLHENSLFVKLKNLLGEIGFLSDPVDCRPYCRGARYGQGDSLAVLRPDSHEQVVEIVRLCREHHQALVLQGANTGLVAASTPDGSGRFLVLSLERLKKYIAIDVVNRSVEVDAGLCLHELNQALEEHGLFFPIDLAANPSVGGMIAANTGGAKLIKYGDVRQNLLGLRAVLMEPAGQVLDLRHALRKNNTGPDLKHLFVGSSGSFGVITRAVLQVHYLPKQTAVALVVPRDQSAVLELLQVLERDCGEYLSAYEGISGAALDAVLRHVPAITQPFHPEPCPEYCVLIELSSRADASTGLDLNALLSTCLEKLFGTVVENAVIGRAKDLWRIRHAISEALRHEGRVIAFDISMPRSNLVDYRAQALQLIDAHYPWIRVMDFGHWADGGCHFNLVWPSDAAEGFSDRIVQQIRDQIYDLVVLRHQGSFSAEHGVGPYNQMYYQRYTSPMQKHLSGQIQGLLDPENLLGLCRFGE